MRKTHTTPRYRISIKRYTHEILKRQSQSGMKLQMKVILASGIDLISEFKLVSSRGFLLSRREAEFVKERELFPLEGWTTVFVDSEDTVETLEAVAVKSRIPKYLIVDHIIRLIRDLKMLSSDRKGKLRLREAIEGRKEAGSVVSDEELGNADDSEPDLYPWWTHSFFCEKSGEHLPNEVHVNCPISSHESAELGSQCIQNCDHLTMKVKRDFQIPEGWYINYNVQFRLGTGRGQESIHEEALDKGWKEYLRSMS